MTRIDLPDGAWAELRDPKKVPEVLRRPVTMLQAQMAIVVDVKALEKAKNNVEKTKILGTEGIRLSQEIGDLATVALVASWSFGDVITEETVKGLPGDAYDVLTKATAPMALQMHVRSEPTPDPASPSEPSQP